MRRDPRRGQPPQRLQPLGRGRRARFEFARQFRVERSDRDRHRHQPPLGQLGQQVEIGEHAVGLGGDRNRMARVEAHFEHLPRDPVACLDRLVGIGIGPHRQRARAVFGLGQRDAQQFRRIGLGEQSGFEIEPGREVVIGMGGPRKAIDAAMLAAAIGIDRAVEGHIGRLVEAEDRAREFLGHFGAQFGRSIALQYGELLHMIAPVAVFFARGEAEARRHRRALCAAS